MRKSACLIALLLTAAVPVTELAEKGFAQGN
jgi:hypothetical protein